MRPEDALETALESADALHPIEEAITAVKAAGAWSPAVEARVRDRLTARFEAQDISVERRSHWTNANFTALVDPYSVGFSGPRLDEVFEQTRFGHGFARTLRLQSRSRWDRKLDAKDGAALADCAALAQLQGLEIAEQGLGPQGVAALAASPYLSSLRALSVTGSKTGLAGARAIAANPALAHLEILILSQGRIGSSGVEALAASPHLRRLRVLVLDENQLTARAFEAIAQSANFAGLRWLSLCSNKQVGAAGVVALAASPHLRSIEVLHLARVNMRTTGAKALAKSPILDSVRALNTLGNNITPTGQAALEGRMAAQQER